MIFNSLAFLCGVLLLQNFSFLPNLYWAWILLFVTMILLLKKIKVLNIIAILFLGFIWSMFYAHHRLNWHLPKEIEGKTAQAIGYVASLPAYSSHHFSFLFLVKKLDNQSVNHLIKISWLTDNQRLKVGDKWLLNVRIKKICGLMNPGGFNYEAWAFQQGIRAQGYVVSKTNNQLLKSNWRHDSLNRFRQYLQEKIERNLPSSNTSPWIEALVLGERHNIAAKNWEVLRNTGTNHLMAIAGLHIGFMASLFQHLTSRVWCKIPFLMLRIPAQIAGAIGALIIAAIYSALAGFSIPTQRATIMLSVFLIAVLLRRNIVPWHAWAIALCLVLIINPLDVLTESFWLSFGSVALIIYGMCARIHAKNWWWKWGRVQWVIALGLIPFSIWLFHQFSLIGFIANSIAIPYVAIVIVPLCLLGGFMLLISVKLGAPILILADKLLAILWWILSYLAHLPGASWLIVMPNFYVLLTSCIGVILLLSPIGFPGRYIGLIWLLPLVLHKSPSPKLGEAWLTLLDVGQGLSAIVQTHNHLLVYDTGSRLSDNYDMGESVVSPFLHTLGIHTINMMVISHGDNDHIGGANTLLKNFTVESIKTSVPEKFPKHSSICSQGESWEWDRVNFKFLYPSPNNLDLGNNSSCVLQIISGNNRVLIPGDIEKMAEKNLVNNDLSGLRSKILIAPHHGSKTSIHPKFVEAVHPEFVLYSIGYRNRYHFPHQSTIKLYNLIQSQQENTVTDGAIQFSISNLAVKLIHKYRCDNKHYWDETVGLQIGQQI